MSTGPTAPSRARRKRHTREKPPKPGAFPDKGPWALISYRPPSDTHSPVSHRCLWAPFPPLPVRGAQRGCASFSPGPHICMHQTVSPASAAETQKRTLRKYSGAFFLGCLEIIINFMYNKLSCEFNLVSWIARRGMVKNDFDIDVKVNVWRNASPRRSLRR